MPFSPGDRVHLRGVGTGVVRELRGSARYAIDIKGRIVVAPEGSLERADAPPKNRHRAAAEDTPGGAALHGEDPGARGRTLTLDLHGQTAADAVTLVERFINEALLEGAVEVRLIHGRSGGRVKAAVQHFLRDLVTVANQRIDPHNPGVTIVTFA